MAEPISSSPADAEVILKVDNVAQSFGGVQAVRGVSFSIKRGDFVGLIGPNGAGKSTLLECISGAINSYSGSVEFEGRDVTRQPMHRVAAQGLVRSFQISRIFERLTVATNLMVAPPAQEGEKIWRAVFGGWRAQEERHVGNARAMLEKFELSRLSDSYASEASGGQRRLVELSRALLTEPRMLLLDEPFAGVSPANRQRLGDWLLALNRENGLTILMVEHRLEQVERLCSTAVVLANGKVIARDSLARLRDDPQVVAAYFGA